MPAPLLTLHLCLTRREGGDRIMSQVLAAVPTHGLDAVLVAVEMMLETGAVSVEPILNAIGRLCQAPSHLLSKRYERTSVIITTNLMFSEWSSVFADAKMTPLCRIG